MRVRGLKKQIVVNDDVLTVNWLLFWVNGIFVICMYRYFVTHPLSKSWSLLFDLCCLSHGYMTEILQIWHKTLSNRSTVLWFLKLIKKLLPFYFQGPECFIPVNSTATPPTTTSSKFNNYTVTQRNKLGRL